jgi:hypothetical protein
MKAFIISLLLFTLFAFKGEKKDNSKRQPCLTNLDGKGYSYYVNNRSDLAFYFIFYCEGDSLRGAILGPNIQNPSVSLYFRTVVNNVKIEKDTVSFNFIQGQLYTSPFTLSSYKNYGGPLSVGFAQERLYYKGIMKGDGMMNLKCQNKDYACSVDSIVFRKIK